MVLNGKIPAIDADHRPRRQVRVGRDARHHDGVRAVRVHRRDGMFQGHLVNPLVVLVENRHPVIDIEVLAGLPDPQVPGMVNHGRVWL
jgi:hypothetical protein